MTAVPPTERECREWLALIRAHHRDGGSADAETLGQAGISPLSGGRNNLAYRCAREGRACCIKVYRADGRQRDEREWHALTFLAARLPGLAPRPLCHEPDESLPMVAMEYLPGTPLLNQALAEEHLDALAWRLRQIYALTPAAGELPFTAESAVPKIIARIEHGAATGPPEVRACLGDWLDSTDPAFLSTPAAPVFGLADPNLLNWLWDSSARALRRVDLEYASWCDLATELADLIEGPWARGLPDADWLAFARRFADLDLARFAAARRMFAHFWVALYSERGNERLSQQLARAARLVEER